MKNAKTRKPRLFNHLVDLAFEVEGPWEDFEDIPMEAFIKGLERRIRILKEENCTEAFGFCESSEVEPWMMTQTERDEMFKKFQKIA